MDRNTRRPPGGRWGSAHLRPMAGVGQAGQAEAAALLKSYHRQVEEWFVEFAQARARQRKREWACTPAGQGLRAAASLEPAMAGPTVIPLS
jgi:hypothetical protein